MGEQLVMFETAKLAKEKGFNIKTQWVLYRGVSTVGYSSYKDNSDYLLQPTQSLLQKWLREIHNINIDIETLQKEKKIVYGYDLVYTIETLHVKSSKERFKTYEQALEDSLQEALRLTKE